MTEFRQPTARVRNGAPATQGTIPPHADETIGSGFAGEIIRPCDPEYDSTRRVWNGMIDRHPRLIARPRTLADIKLGIRFALDHQLPLAVRGGGHNVTGSGTCDDGLVLDLSLMRTVDVDPVERVVRAQGGATWGDLDRAAAAYGLATTGGMISSTGIGGLTLGGGVGWLMRAYGLACDNLLQTTLVTARNEVITVDDARNPDLFAALRGGGGNFGVVHEFTYRLHPVTEVLGGYVIHTVERAQDVLDFYAHWCRTAPDTVTTAAAFFTAPTDPALPAALRGKPALMVALCALGDADEREQLAEALRRFGPPAVDLVQPMPYPQQQSLLDAGSPPGMRNYWKPGYISDLPPRLIADLVEFAACPPSPSAQILIHQLGGAVARVPPGHTAAAHRDAPYLVNAVGMWDSPSDDDRNISWVRSLHKRLNPFCTGTYVNYLADEGPAAATAAYDPATRALLERVKTRWDPDNIFRPSHNVSPRPESASG
ncbi:FAD-binding oxidoreductase [Streptomyces sp. NPDC007205]|uniref:FAD-binding oxidoreductase n=1 Tax=Streptomyces sp. NPDC007205 TaxID=3154316 RepID=UPI0033DC0BD0